MDTWVYKKRKSLVSSKRLAPATPKAQLEVSEEAILAARTRIIKRHQNESWAGISRSIGLPKTTIRFFAERDYLPKRGDVLLKLLAGDEPHENAICERCGAIIWGGLQKDKESNDEPVG